MSLATLAPPAILTVADLLEGAGDIPLDRIRMQPPPGTATEEDVIAIHSREKRLCELVDGTLVEKPMGFDESRLRGSRSGPSWWNSSDVMILGSRPVRTA